MYLSDAYVQKWSSFPDLRHTHKSGHLSGPTQKWPLKCHQIIAIAETPHRRGERHVDVTSFYLVRIRRVLTLCTLFDCVLRLNEEGRKKIPAYPSSVTCIIPEKLLFYVHSDNWSIAHWFVKLTWWQQFEMWMQVCLNQAFPKIDFLI